MQRPVSPPPDRLEPIVCNFDKTSLKSREDLQSPLSPMHGSKHTFSESERSVFVKHINKYLENCEDLKHVIPIQEDNLFENLKNGVILCKLLSVSFPSCIDDSKITTVFKDEKSKTYNQLINLGLCIEAAKKAGAVVVNLGPEDIRDGKVTLVFGLLWQIIKLGMLQEVTVAKHPELLRLTEGEEDLSSLVPEDLLIKWVNWYLRKSSCPILLRNFSSDVKDSVAYIYLMNQLAPDVCTLEPLSEYNLIERANLMLSFAEKIGCRSFLNAPDVVSGNDRLNLVFAAALFNKHIGMVPITEEIEKENGSLMKENEYLRKQLAELENQLQEAALTASQKDERVEELTKDLKSLAEESNGKIQELTKKMNEVRSRNEKLEHDVNSTVQEKIQVENHKQELSKKCNDLENKIKLAETLLEQEKLSLETSEECGFSLAQDLEHLRSRQEKMEYLIEHLKIERMKSYLHVERLRILYNSFSSTEALCEAIYGNLTLSNISKGASKVGYLTKKARQGNSWRYRFFVLRDNFLFYFKSDSSPQLNCNGVVRVDDAVLRFAENPTKRALKDHWLLCIEVPYSDSNENLSFYIAGEDHELESWRVQIKAAAAWWTKQSYRKND